MLKAEADISFLYFLSSSWHSHPVNATLYKAVLEWLRCNHLFCHTSAAHSLTPFTATDKRKQYVVYAACIMSMGMGTPTSLQVDSFKNNGYRVWYCRPHVHAYRSLEYIVVCSIGSYTSCSKVGVAVGYMLVLVLVMCSFWVIPTNHKHNGLENLVNPLGSLNPVVLDCLHSRPLVKFGGFWTT